MKPSFSGSRGSLGDSRPSVLCVDDEHFLLATLESAFTAAGFKVETADNGFNALQKLAKNPNGFKALVTDLRMPGGDGFALIERSRSAGYAGPIIVYAASITPEARHQLEDLRVQRIIEKPARSSDLITAVREAMGGH